MKSLGVIPFGDLAPDAADLLNVGVEDARDVVACAQGYCPLPNIAPYSEALAAAAIAGAVTVDKSDIRRFYAATADRIYSLSGAVWTDRSQGAAAYNTATRWEFVPWGETLQAWSFENDPQVIDLGGVEFADLTTTSIRARTAGVIDNRFVMAGNTFDDTDGNQPDRVRWCAADAPTSWDISSVTGADFQNLRSGRGVQRVMGGEYGIILSRNAIHRAQFVGSPLWFQIDPAEFGIGTAAPRSAVRRGNRVFFLSDDGFRVTTGAGESALIGSRTVDSTVLADLDGNHIERVLATTFYEKQSILWAYPGAGNTLGRPNKLAMYNYALDRWAFGDEVVDALMDAAVPFQSLDDLDPVYPDLDLMPGTLDDASFSGGRIQLGIISSDNKLGFLTDPGRTGLIETAEASIVPGRRSFIRGVRVLVVGQATVRTRVGHRNSVNDPVVWTDWSSENAQGVCPLRVDNRYIRLQVELSGDYEYVFGVEPLGGPSSAH